MMAEEREGSQASQKRDHDSFADLVDLEEPCSVPADFAFEETQVQGEPDDAGAKGGDGNMARSIEASTGVSEIGIEMDSTPPPAKKIKLSSAAEETSPNTTAETDLSTPTSHEAQGPANPSTNGNISTASTAFTALNGVPPPAPKKAKLTFAEKEAKRIEREFAAAAKAEEKARKEAERAAHAEEKARREAEKEAERQAHAAEKARKEAEKKKKDEEREEKRRVMEAEKAAKEEKKRKKEEEKVKAEEEKRRKERSQKRLGAFFSMAGQAKRGASVESRERSSMSPAPSR